MYLKLLALVIFGGLLALTTLVLRQQRLETMHRIVKTHAQINQDRQATWDYQVRIASKLDPESLVQAAQRQDIRLRPLFDPPVDPMDPADGPQGPEDGRFVSSPAGKPRPEPAVSMVTVSPATGAGEQPILIPVLDPEPARRNDNRPASRR